MCCVVIFFIFFFFFKQKTAYEMRISDWSSDVCSSDLGVELTDDHAERSSLMTWRWLAGQCGAVVALALGFGHFFAGEGGLTARENYAPFASVLGLILTLGAFSEIGRASCRERVCQYV